VKPEWKDAPEWAKFLAMDSSGTWLWYSREPSDGEEAWYGFGRYEIAGKDIHWRDTLEPRP
jgi:hypothetical protein